VLIFTLGGTPFLWNGAEVCDENENNMFSNRFFGRRNSIDWSGLVTDKGKRRMKLIKRLSKLYHSEKALSHGETCFVKELTQKGVMAYERSYENENIWVFINFSDVECDLEKYLPEKDFNVILVNGAGFDTDRVILTPTGYIVLKEIIENVQSELIRAIETIKELQAQVGTPIGEAEAVTETAVSEGIFPQAAEDRSISVARAVHMMCFIVVSFRYNIPIVIIPFPLCFCQDICRIFTKYPPKFAKTSGDLVCLIICVLAMYRDRWCSRYR
jgi:hypothetical protein